MTAVVLMGASPGGCDHAADQRIEVAAVWKGDEQKQFMQVLDAFTDRTGVTVDYIKLDETDVTRAVTDLIQDAKEPHVAMLPQPGLLRQLATCGELHIMPPETQQEVIANSPRDQPPEAYPGVFDNKFYGVWFKAANKSIVWYDVEDFRSSNVGPSRTWDGFLSALATLAENEPPLSIAAQADYGWVLTDLFENVYLQLAGKDNYDALAQGHDIDDVNQEEAKRKRDQISWTDETVITSLTKLAELWKDERLLVGGTAGALSTEFDSSVTQVFNDKEEGSIVITGDFAASHINTTEARVGEDAQFFSFPKINPLGPRSVIAAGDIAVMMKDSPGARQLMRFLAEPAAAQIWAGQGGFISPYEEIIVNSPDWTSRRSAASLHAATIRRFDLSDQLPPSMGSTRGAGMWKELRAFFAKEQSASTTAKNLQAAADVAAKEECPAPVGSQE